MTGGFAMLTDLRIENFKSWENTGRIRLAPITVFFGTNSSGKSSIAQLLLMLQQTAASSDRSRVLDTGDREAQVDVGSYREFIHHHDVKRDLRFELRWTQVRPFEVRDILDSTVRFSDTHLALESQIYADERRPNDLRVRYFKYSLGGESVKFSAGLTHSSGNRYSLDVEGMAPRRTRGRPWELPAPGRFYGFPDEAVAYYQNTEFLQDLSLAFERALDSISYLGPLRIDPERVYIWAGGTPEDVGILGDRTVDALLAAPEERKFNLQAGQHLRSLQGMVAERLHALGLIQSFRVAPIAPGRPEHEVRVRVSADSDEVLLTDVGFGLSQVLPVVVQSFYAQPNSTIVMEQPELHLHPSVQQNLADFFVAAANARENGEARGIQFIIESHSEHFLRRLQRRIADETIGPESVALYFCERKGGRSALRELDVDLFGNVTNWPVDFFGDPMEDVVAQSEAQLRRRMSESA